MLANARVATRSELKKFGTLGLSEIKLINVAGEPVIAGGSSLGAFAHRSLIELGARAVFGLNTHYVDSNFERATYASQGSWFFNASVDANEKTDLVRHAELYEWS